MGALADSWKTQFEIINGRRASASQRDGVIMQLRERRVPVEFIDAHLPQSEDGPALLAGATKAVTRYRESIVADLKSKGVADEVVNAHVPADLTQSGDFAAGAARALARHQELSSAGNNAAAINATRASFLNMMPK